MFDEDEPTFDVNIEQLTSKILQATTNHNLKKAEYKPYILHLIYLCSKYMIHHKSLNLAKTYIDDIKQHILVSSCANLTKNILYNDDNKKIVKVETLFEQAIKYNIKYNYSQLYEILQLYSIQDFHVVMKIDCSSIIFCGELSNCSLKDDSHEHEIFINNEIILNNPQPNWINYLKR